MSYSNKIQQKLNEKGMTQSELANKCEVHPSYISEVVNGKRTGIKLSLAFKIVKYLGEKRIEDVFTFKK